MDSMVTTHWTKSKNMVTVELFIKSFQITSEAVPLFFDSEADNKNKHIKSKVTVS